MSGGVRCRAWQTMIKERAETYISRATNGSMSRPLSSCRREEAPVRAYDPGRIAVLDPTGFLCTAGPQHGAVRLQCHSTARTELERDVRAVAAISFFRGLRCPAVHNTADESLANGVESRWGHQCLNSL